MSLPLFNIKDKDCGIPKREKRQKQPEPKVAPWPVALWPDVSIYDIPSIEVYRIEWLGIVK
ncbi:MAG: hypothetical protein A2Z19_02890 [Deltaproteobacteria bacterium RBG_16_54_18]|nr:MAG: hypothetical protein A2Z19_02890 [Deltaproteobacteria bacterium RBG_16_54_18]